jgi:hypothetical protein
MGKGRVYTSDEREQMHKALDDMLDRRLGVTFIGASQEVAPEVVTTLSDRVLRTMWKYLLADSIIGSYTETILTTADGKKVENNND